jgi:hypothetical protein
MVKSFAIYGLIALELIIAVLDIAYWYQLVI